MIRFILLDADQGAADELAERFRGRAEFLTAASAASAGDLAATADGVFVGPAAGPASWCPPDRVWPLAEAPAVVEARLAVERERRPEDDLQWCFSDRDVRRGYGGTVVAVHGRKVWGSGDDIAGAVAAATASDGCPPAEELAVALIPFEPHLDEPFTNPRRPWAQPAGRTGND